MQVASVEGRDEWGEAVGRTFYPLAVVSAARDFRARIRQVDLGRGVSAAEVRCGPNVLRRMARQIRDAPSDDVLLLVQLAGSAELSQSDRQLRLPPGWATLCDPLVEYGVASGECSHQLVLLLPRQIVRSLATPVSATRLQALAPSALSLRALTAVAEEAVSQGEGLSFSESDAVAGVIGDLVRSLLASSSGSSGRGRSREELAASALTFIREHHAQPELSPETVAAAMRISVRTLVSVLRDRGSPSRIIRGERLANARTMLTDVRHEHETIARIARRSGFTDQTTFIRAFRREFGGLPSDLRRELSA